jgi:hypothetical protein
MSRATKFVGLIRRTTVKPLILSLCKIRYYRVGYYSNPPKGSMLQADVSSATVQFEFFRILHLHNFALIPFDLYIIRQFSILHLSFFALSFILECAYMRLCFCLLRNKLIHSVIFINDIFDDINAISVNDLICRVRRVMRDVYRHRPLHVRLFSTYGIMVDVRNALTVSIWRHKNKQGGGVKKTSWIDNFYRITDLRFRGILRVIVWETRTY